MADRTLPRIDGFDWRLAPAPDGVARDGRFGLASPDWRPAWVVTHHSSRVYVFGRPHPYRVAEWRGVALPWVAWLAVEFRRPELVASLAAGVTDDPREAWEIMSRGPALLARP